MYVGRCPLDGRQASPHRFKLINLSIYRLASIPKPSTNRPGPVSPAAAPEEPPAVDDDDDAIGAPPRSRKKLTAAEPVVLRDRPRVRERLFIEEKELGLVLEPMLWG